MEYRTRLAAAVSATVGLFLVVQLGALALVDPYVAAEAQPVDDPGDPGNVLLFFGVILAATAVMLAAIKFDLEQLIRGFVILTCGYISWIVLSTVLSPFAPAGGSTIGTAAGWATVLVPAVVAVGMIAALLVHPEWYVVDAAGVLLGAGAAGLFGLAFTPELTVAFLVILAAYDAISVYGTEHMLELAEGVSDLHVPVMLVIPTVSGYSLLDDEGPETLEDRGEDDGEAASETDENQVEAASNAGEADVTDTAADDAPEEPSDAERDALYIGLGDAVMPTILVASAAVFMREAAPLYDVPVLAVNAPAVGALVGTLVGLTVLLLLVLKGRAHAGLPLLNGGAIAGYLLGAVASGVTVAEALGLPL